jgi:hypothetical protein
VFGVFYQDLRANAPFFALLGTAMKILGLRAFLERDLVFGFTNFHPDY